MRLISVFTYLLLFSTLLLAQDKLPEQLTPSEYALAEAKRLDARVFKLLPRGTYENPEGTYGDTDNAIGIRQGGSYYSFTTGSHSYNKIPQIELQQGNIMVGFAGAHYGFIADLGSISLADVSEDLPAAVAILGYSPPRYYQDCYEEAKRSHGMDLAGRRFVRRIPAVERHTYLLRAISFDQADKVVALNVVNKNKDGSIEIVWKSIKDLAVPRMMRQTESELRAKIGAILSDPEFAGITWTVKDDVVTLAGSAGRPHASRLLSAIAGARPGKLINEIMFK